MRAFASVVSQTDLNLFLIFHQYLDRDSNYEKELRSLAVELGVAERVIWLEGIADDQMPVLYSLSNVVINFPDYDGLPVSFFEAAACKKPVITNNLRAYRELLENGAFVVVPAGDLVQLAIAIERVFYDSDRQMEQKLEKNYELILQVADQRKCIYQMEQVYFKLTKGNSRV